MKDSRILSGGLIAALLSSLCCITPVLAMIAGTGSIAASFSWFEPARPYLAGITIGVLGFAWYRKIFPKKESPDCACDPDLRKSFWHTKIFLSIITVFVLSIVSFPHYAHVFYPHNEKQTLVVPAANINEVEITISGMTCQGCAEHVNHALDGVSGVMEHNTSYEQGKSLIKFDRTKTTQQKLIDAVNATGFTVAEARLLESEAK